MKKVAFLIHNIYGGGAEKVLCNLTLGLDNKKYEKYIIIFEHSDSPYLHDANLINLEYKEKKNKIQKILGFIERYYKIKKIKKQYNFDTVISFTTPYNLLNILTKRRDSKTIISVRNFLSKEYENSNIISFFIKHLFKYADLITIVSEEAKKDLIDNFNIDPSMIEVIYNPYDIEKINKTSKESIDYDYIHIFKKPTLINIGRLDYQKGQIHLIRIMEKLRKYVDVNLIILGDGPLKQELQEYINKCDLNDRVFLLGRQKNPYKFLFNSDIYISTSYFEGFPNAMVEAMICKVPVIHTNCKSGPKEILFKNPQNFIDYNIPAEYGILIPPVDDDKELLYDGENIAIEHILSLLNNQNYTNEFISKGYLRANEFSLSVIIEKWRKIID